MKLESTTALRFWIVNAALWSLYIAFNLLLTATYVGWISGVVFISVVLGVGMFVVSGALRAVAQRQRWFDHGAAALTGRVVLGVLIGATLVQLLIAVALWPAMAWHWVELPGGKADYRPAAAFSYWVNTAIMLGLWAAGWVGAHALRRARHGEIGRLRAESAQRALELDALRARLNPHFIFNALNNLRALINEDTERAREMVTRLSNTLRHALEHSERELVPLAEELAVVEDYLAIEGVHYEQRLRLRIEVEAAARAALVPPMLLQLLVENAIKHGIARTPGGGELKYSARLVPGRLLLEVVSPGTLESNPARRGVGLDYLRARLARLPVAGRFELLADGDLVRACLEIPQ